MTPRPNLRLITSDHPELVERPTELPPAEFAQMAAGGSVPPPEQAAPREPYVAEWMLDEGRESFRNTRAARRYRLAIACVWASAFALAAWALKAAL